MAFDTELATRIRAIVAGRPHITEQRMFGGLAFLIAGHMAVAASGHGGILVRVDPSQTATLLAEPRVTRMEMGGRQMDGWLRVSAESVAEDEELRAWVERGLEYAGSLPPK